MILYQQGLRNRDVDHESYLAFLTVVDHDIGDNPTGVHLLHIHGIQEIIGEFVRGISKTRSLWYHIVQQGPGDESDVESDEDFYYHALMRMTLKKRMKKRMKTEEFHIIYFLIHVYTLQL